MTPEFTSAESKVISELLSTFEKHHDQLELFRNQLLGTLTSSSDLNKLVHSVRSRVKDPDHLRDKLLRRLHECKERKKKFTIRPENLLTKVTDLVGIRVLHLYTAQIKSIDVAMREVFAEYKLNILEGPFARTWDDESRQFFASCNIETQQSPSMYTSVHYVIGSFSRTKMTAEIQVRTLMEEVWGEVDHTINYPHPVHSLPCREQLKVLARVTSSASRLVDSIFLSFDDHQRLAPRRVRR